jgi:hypothetical protein
VLTLTILCITSLCIQKQAFDDNVCVCVCVCVHACVRVRVCVRVGWVVGYSSTDKQHDR